MKINRLVLVLLIFSALFFSGCWDYTEYEHLAMANSVGIDFDESSKKITVTFEYTLTSAGGSKDGGAGGNTSSSKSESIKASGYTIAEALSNIQQTVRKELFFPYLSIVVVGKDAAENIMADIIGYIDRTPQVHTSTYLCITPGRAEDVLSTADPISSLPIGKRIHDIIEQSSGTGKAFPVTISQFEETLSVSGKDCVAPRINVFYSKNTAGESGPSGGSRSTGASGSPGGISSSSEISSSEEFPYRIMERRNGYQYIDGIAAFKSDKLAGFLEGKECTGFGWIMNRGITPYEYVQTSPEKETKNMQVFRVSKSESKIEVELKGGTPEITISTYMEADLRKQSESGQDILTPGALKEMEKGLAENVKEEINAAIKKGQKELKTDIFCFGFDFYRKYPKLWHSDYEKKWETIYPGIKINVNVTAKIINTGTNVKKFAPH